MNFQTIKNRILDSVHSVTVQFNFEPCIGEQIIVRPDDNELYVIFGTVNGVWGYSQLDKFGNGYAGGDGSLDGDTATDDEISAYILHVLNFLYA